MSARSGRPALSIQGISKRYRIGRRVHAQDTITGMVTSWLRSPLTNYRQIARLGRFDGDAGDPDVLWALRDVSFDIGQGEVVGIIGRNGAGKSTLLKVLSRITSPTSGRAVINGRAASLLEVGTGFHPELTGRENVYLSGTLLGMTRAEVTARFDEIVAFSGVDQFIDTPVRRYSSGMQVRLAFSVAAHLDPEILIIDEVLAVGDAEFQKRSLDKMRAVVAGGQTILFVSHNMQTIQSFCQRCILLDHGRVAADLPAADAVRLYLGADRGHSTFERPWRGKTDLEIVGGTFTQAASSHGAEGRVSVDLQAAAPLRVAMDVRLKDALGQPVAFGSFGALEPRSMLDLTPGRSRVTFRMPLGNLANGAYSISIDVTQPGSQYLDRAEDCLTFDLERPPRDGALHVLPQGWGYGSTELLLADLTVHPDADVNVLDTSPAGSRR